jgi:hypothetical protein
LTGRALVTADATDETQKPLTSTEAADFSSAAKPPSTGARVLPL